jgi:hemerythrin superfamily protein
MLDAVEFEKINKAIRRSSDKDSKAYKITEYYQDLTDDTLNEGHKIWVRSKVLSIEKELHQWVIEHQNDGVITRQSDTMMQPEEMALVLIEDLRERGLLS